MTRKNGE